MNKFSWELTLTDISLDRKERFVEFVFHRIKPDLMASELGRVFDQVSVQDDVRECIRKNLSINGSCLVFEFGFTELIRSVGSNARIYE